MPAIETVEIQSPKNPAEMWRINAVDFDPKKHTRWDAPPAPDAPPAIDDGVVGDYLTDGTGAVTQVTIVDPDDKRARKIINADSYDPDMHTLWSERGRR